MRAGGADGNKLFQSEFISIIYPGADLVQQLEFNLLNSSVALFGYYLAAFTIDLPWMGRRGMQVHSPRPLLGFCSDRSNPVLRGAPGLAASALQPPSIDCIKL